MPWSTLAHDKYLFNVTYKALNFPVPDVLALYQDVARAISDPMLTNRNELETFLMCQDNYPLVCKPLFGIYSHGVTAAEAYDDTAAEIVLTSGECTKLSDYVDNIVNNKDRTLFGKAGYIFQSLLTPHRKIVEICGSRICTLRLVVLLDNDGPNLYRTLWKISSGDNMADNFWRSGNFLAALDAQTGTVLDVVDGSGENRKKSAFTRTPGENSLGSLYRIGTKRSNCADVPPRLFRI